MAVLVLEAEYSAVVRFGVIVDAREANTRMAGWRGAAVLRRGDGGLKMASLGLKGTPCNTSQYWNRFAYKSRDRPHQAFKQTLSNDG
jgi:hypothetical protein